MSQWNLGVDVIPSTTNTYKLGDADHKFILNGHTYGVAPLDSTGKVSSDYLPSYVDDVLEYATKDNFPATGETGKIYVDLATDKTYRWSGSVYIEISQDTMIPYIVGTGSTAGTWGGECDQITSLYDGLLILYKPSVAGASTTKLTINSLGAKTVYFAGSSKLTTHFPANQPILLVYSTSQNSGCWMCIDCYTDGNTKNTAGSTDTASKIFIIGATSQAANPQTYSQDTAYVGTDGHVYSNSKQVVNLSDTQALTNKTYNGYTLAAACAKGVTDNSSATAPSSTDTNLITGRTLYNAIASTTEIDGLFT